MTIIALVLLNTTLKTSPVKSCKPLKLSIKFQVGLFIRTIKTRMILFKFAAFISFAKIGSLTFKQERFCWNYRSNNKITNFYKNVTYWEYCICVVKLKMILLQCKLVCVNWSVNVCCGQLNKDWCLLLRQTSDNVIRIREGTLDSKLYWYTHITLKIH